MFPSAHPGGPMEVSALASNPLPPALWIALAIGLGALAVGFALGLAAARARRGRARDVFSALAAEALRANAEDFIVLANERFQRLEEGSESDWEVRRKALDDTVGPLREALDRYPVEAHQLERVRAHLAGELGNEGRDLNA